MIARPGHTTPDASAPLTGQQYHPPMEIRLATPADAEAIRSIYNVEVLDSTNTFDMVPRTRAEQEAWLAEHQGRPPGHRGHRGTGRGHRGPRGAGGELVLGFGSLSVFRSRSGYAGHGRELGLRGPGRPGQGRGAGPARRALVLASAHGFHSLIARIAGHNEVSIGLHQRRRVRAGRASNARSGASTASGSTWSSSSGCSEARPD